MKESNFIKKNLDSWQEYEKLVNLKEKQPNKLSRLFTKITDDLSFAYTYYNNRSVRVYLNGVARQLFNRVNNSERFRFSSLKKFYFESVPLAIFNARREFYIAFTVFVISMLIGILSSKYDPEFAQLILGDDYIKMTEANIAENDPMAVYKSQAPFDMFFSITLNNCLVALRTFVFGFFLAIGTILIMLYNGIMVGSFQYFFVEQGLFKESFLTIWQHGVFEISSIIMAGAAGLVLGRGLVFPGNYSRFQSLRISARRGLKLFLGIVPILIIAAFIEGFYTRYTSAPDFVRVLSILISLALIVGYFIILPRLRGKQYADTNEVDNKIEVPGTVGFESNRIYTGPELFMQTFQQLKNNFWKIMKWVLLSALIFPISLFLIDWIGREGVYSGIGVFRAFETLNENSVSNFILLFSFSILAMLLSKIRIDSVLSENSSKPTSFSQFVQTVFLLALVHLSLLIPSPFFGILIFISLMVYAIFILNIVNINRLNLISAIRYSTYYLKGNFSKFFYLSLRYLVLAILFYIVFMKLIATLNNELVQMNLYGSAETGSLIIYYVNVFYFISIALFTFSVIYLGLQLLYFSLHESFHATDLISKISQIGKTKRIRGLLRE